MTKRTPVRDERGQILIITAVTLTVILGIAALSVDASFMYDKRNRLYAAADAAAKGAALELARNPTATDTILQTFAYREITNLGFNPGGATVVGLWHSGTGPIDGSFAGNTNYVEVKVSENTATFFGGILGISSLTPAAWAVAGVVPSSTCMLALRTSGLSVVVSGAANIQAPSCAVMANSTGTPAMDIGGSGTIQASEVDVAASPPSPGRWSCRRRSGRGSRTRRRPRP